MTNPASAEDELIHPLLLLSNRQSIII